MTTLFVVVPISSRVLDRLHSHQSRSNQTAATKLSPKHRQQKANRCCRNNTQRFACQNFDHDDHYQGELDDVPDGFQGGGFGHGLKLTLVAWWMPERWLNDATTNVTAALAMAIEPGQQHKQREGDQPVSTLSPKILFFRLAVKQLTAKVLSPIQDSQQDNVVCRFAEEQKPIS